MSPMSTQATATPRAVRRSAVVAAFSAGVLGAAALFAPLVASAEPTSTHHHHTQHPMTAESVDQRIAKLHARLEITPAEEADWAQVAQAMRDNEARMRGMVTARAAEPAHDVSAVEDIKIYERFNQAHVEGLKALISSFEVLYTAMPDDQKRLADRVFHKFGHHAHSRA